MYSVMAFKLCMAHMNSILLILFCLGYMPENMGERVRYDAFGLRCRRIAGHGVRFAGASLSVRQYCAIVAFQDFVDYWTGGVDVQIDLEFEQKE